MKNVKIPTQYRSLLFSKIKEKRRKKDKYKNDYSPTKIHIGNLEFIISSHFGFCFGVENALEIAYRTLAENPQKKIYLLSEMIHNPAVNQDLISRGLKFIFNTRGEQLVQWEELKPEDIVIIPAFGSTTETEEILSAKGIDILQYNTTCPFVKRVWKRAVDLGEEGATVVIHGKHDHEETKATFSHTVKNAHSLIVKNKDEAELLAKIITGEIPRNDFYRIFEGKYSSGFEIESHLNKIGIVNQTTMLAEETEIIARLLKNALEKKFGPGYISDHFIDTRETLCYATNNNQTATKQLLLEDADFAIVVGGYNSSNTSHIVELLSQKFKVYFINSESNILSNNEIRYYDIITKNETVFSNFWNLEKKQKIIITSGASCPDSVVEKVLIKLVNLYDNRIDLTKIIEMIDEIE